MQIYFRSKRNIAVDKVAFHKRKQEEGETFDKFYVALTKLAENAEICSTCREEQLVTKIMCDMINTTTKKKLLAISPTPSL